MSLRGLLFDKDGTLFDFQRSWGPWLAGLLDTLAVDSPHALRLAEVLGFDLRSHSFRPDSVFVHDTLEEIAGALLPLLPDWNIHTLKAYAMVKAARVPQVPTVPLAPLLAQFKSRGLVLGVATNDNEKPARAQLDRAGVLAKFDFVAGYDSGYGSKPGTGMQRAFCAAHGLAAGDVAMVGDSLHDMVAGKAAGMVAIGVLTGPASRTELETVADVVLADIAALEGWMAADISGGGA